MNIRPIDYARHVIAMSGFRPMTEDEETKAVMLVTPHFIELSERFLKEKNYSRFAYSFIASVIVA